VKPKGAYKPNTSKGILDILCIVVFALQCKQMQNFSCLLRAEAPTCLSCATLADSFRIAIADALYDIRHQLISSTWAAQVNMNYIAATQGNKTMITNYASS